MSPPLIKFAKPMFGNAEMRAVASVMTQSVLTNGAQVRGFEQDFSDFCGGGWAAATSSCMGALHICAMALLNKGDEVIVPALTHPATAHAVDLVGAVPVFVDVERETGNISIEALKAALTERTRAIFLVHYLGRPADMSSIMNIARKKELLVIEDCALALGSFYEGKHVGLIGDAGCFSFYPCKHMTTGEGGMILTKHPDLAQKALQLRHFGQFHTKGYGILEPSDNFVSVGFNYRMTEFQGALGRIQIRRMEHFLKRREENHSLLWRLLKKHEKIDAGNYGLSVFIPGRKDRDKLMARMKNKYVQLSVYYRTPVPLTTYYSKKYGYSPGMFPNAEAISNRTVCFPVGPHLKEAEIKRMAKAFGDVL